MSVLTFDPDVTEPPRVRLIHTHRGHVLGVRVPGKSYLVLPSATRGRQGALPGNSLDAVRYSLRFLCRLSASVLEQTGLTVYPWSDNGLAFPEFIGDHQDAMFEPDGSMVFKGVNVLGGELRPNAGFFHPSEWKNSPDWERVQRFVGEENPLPLAYEQVALYPHEVSPGDRHTFPIVGTRYERSIDGEECVVFQYESAGENVALGRDDAYGEDGATEAEEGDGRGRRRRKVVERDSRLGYVWGQPHKLNARIIVFRLGGDFRGPST